MHGMKLSQVDNEDDGTHVYVCVCVYVVVLGVLLYELRGGGQRVSIEILLKVVLFP